jgi:hypothetical protein
VDSQAGHTCCVLRKYVHLQPQPPHQAQVLVEPHSPGLNIDRVCSSCGLWGFNSNLKLVFSDLHPGISEEYDQTAPSTAQLGGGLGRPSLQPAGIPDTH